MNRKLYVPHRPFRTNLYVTYFCNLACEHCLMSCNPGRSQEVLQVSDVLFYIDEFRKKAWISFSKSVLLNGGEATSAYFNHSNDYLPTLTSELLKRKCSLGIHTNSVWAVSKKADLIWNDLTRLYDKNHHEIALGLSCDQYHNNLDGLNEVFKNLSTIYNKNFYPWIMSFEDDPVVKKVQANLSEKYSDFKINYSFYDHVVKIGQAAKNNIGQEVPFYEYYCTSDLCSDGIISFYPDRTASIGSCYTGKRRVSYVNTDRTLKPLEQLYPEIVEKHIEWFIKDNCDLLSLDLLKKYLIPTSQR